jgi:inorganic pyrophosphatase/exopolyphosphatase
MPKTAHKVVVIGHKNPDTDSICSAIAYAELKNQTSSLVCEARRAGRLNQESTFVLGRFGVEPPRMCTDVNPKVRDVDYRELAGVPGDMSLRRAWLMMRDQKIDTLPVVDEAGELAGVITVKDIATANMDVFDTGVLAKSHTSYRNILETLNGQMLVGSADGAVEKGSLLIGAASPELMETAMQPGDIVLLSNRYESQLCAIEMEASLIIVCQSATVGRTIQKLAEENGVAVMSVPEDTYAAAKLISQCAPISHYMTTKDILKFTLVTPIDDVTRVMSKVRHRYFPILDENGKYAGMLSRRNILNLQRRRLILVDHNEATQAVEGYDRAEILEIIDHHRIGSIETSGPVYFRNQPVGCTATIVSLMYDEAGKTPRAPIAGLLLAAISVRHADVPQPHLHARGPGRRRKARGAGGRGDRGLRGRDVRGRRKPRGQNGRGGLSAGLQGVHVRRHPLRRGAGQLYDAQKPVGGAAAAAALPARGALQAERGGPLCAAHRRARRAELCDLHRAPRGGHAAQRLRRTAGRRGRGAAARRGIPQKTVHSRGHGGVPAAVSAARKGGPACG